MKQLCAKAVKIGLRARETLKTGSCRMRFRRSLLELTRLDRQRNPDIRNKLKVNIPIVDIIVTSKELVRQPGINGQKPSSETSF
jgi:hypothetical protein